MLERLKQYRDQRAQAVKGMRALVDTAAKDNSRDLNEAEAKAYAEHEAILGRMDSLIAREEALAERERTIAAGEWTRVEGVIDRETTRPFASLGEQLIAIARVSPEMGGVVDPRLYAVSTPSGASATVGPDGGFLIQKDFVPDLVKEAFDSGALASRCNEHTVSAQADGLEVPYVDETSRATGSRWGGVQVYRRAEADTVTAKQPKLGLWEVRLEDMMGLAYVTERLLQDAAAVGQLFQEAFTDEFAFKLDDEIFNGTGTGQCLGILNAGCTVSVAKEVGQLTKTIVYENITKMWARILPRAMARGAWFYNVEVIPQLINMSIGVGAAGQPVFMPPGGLSTSPYGSLLGRPLIPIEQAAALGTVGDLSFLDLNYYKLVRKGAVQQDESIHVRFIYGERAFRWMTRVNGAPKLKLPITPYKGSSTLSPFITLASR